MLFDVRPCDLPLRAASCQCQHIYLATASTSQLHLLLFIVPFLNPHDCLLLVHSVPTKVTARPLIICAPRLIHLIRRLHSIFLCLVLLLFPRSSPCGPATFPS